MVDGSGGDVGCEATRGEVVRSRPFPSLPEPSFTLLPELEEQPGCSAGWTGPQMGFCYVYTLAGRGQGREIGSSMTHAAFSAPAAGKVQAAGAGQDGSLGRPRAPGAFPLYEGLVHATWG